MRRETEMKASLRRFRGGLGFLKHGGGSGGVDCKNRRDVRPFAQLDELTEASKEMQDMRDCYDSLLSAAAATENCAYEFSESLQDLGGCLVGKTLLVDDEESGKVLQLLGKAQFELQKLVDSYRFHISETITRPSESLLNELQTVEEMKRQCDEKRNIYEYMVTRYREKGRSKTGKGESFSMEQLQAAHEEYDEEATLFVFRLKSLKQGQTRSLLTQAARHHAAQLSFFKKALNSLEAVEPNVKRITEKQHIDYHFTGLDDRTGYDNDDDDDDDDDDSCDEHSDAELSFRHQENDQQFEENLGRSYRHSLSFRGEIRSSSQSAPLFFDQRLNPADKFLQKQPSYTRKFNSYVLPKPGDMKSSNSTESGSLHPQNMKTTLRKPTHNLWHSSPLEQKKFEKTLGDEEFPGYAATKKLSVLRESNNDSASSLLPPPLADVVAFSRRSASGAPDYKKIKRQSFSGPLMSRQPWPSKSALIEHPPLFSGPILRNPAPQRPLSSPKATTSGSPTFTSSPRISELHELPRPPASSAFISSKPSGPITHSGPVVSRSQVLSSKNKLVMSKTSSPLPQPPQSIARSLSTPSGSRRIMALPVSKLSDAADNSVMAEDIVSPPLSPLTLSRGPS